MIKYLLATALFTGKAAQIAAMAIVTLALAAFGKIAFGLRKSIVGTLNDASQNVIDKFVLPKEGASFAGSSSMSGGGASGGGPNLSNMATGASHTVNSAANTMNSLNRAGALLAGGGAVAGGGGMLAGKLLGGKRAEVGTGSGEAGISDVSNTSNTSSINATQAGAERSANASTFGTTSDNVNAVMAGTSAVSDIDANANIMGVRGDAGRMDMMAREYGKDLLEQESLGAASKNVQATGSAMTLAGDKAVSESNMINSENTSAKNVSADNMNSNNIKTDKLNGAASKFDNQTSGLSNNNEASAVKNINAGAVAGMSGVATGAVNSNVNSNELNNNSQAAKNIASGLTSNQTAGAGSKLENKLENMQLAGVHANNMTNDGVKGVSNINPATSDKINNFNNSKTLSSETNKNGVISDKFGSDIRGVSGSNQTNKAMAMAGAAYA